MLLIWMLTMPALAHKPSDSYLTLIVKDQTIEGQWDVALRDLDYAIGLDADDDGRLTWGEVRSRLPEIHEYLLSRLVVKMGSVACVGRPTADLIDRHTDGAYAVLRVSLTCPPPTIRMDILYRLFFDVDPQHRGLVKVVGEEGTASLVFSPEQAHQELTAGASRRWGTFLAYAHEGVHHIWSGIDHLLFLLALLLPSVLHRSNGAWQAASGLRSVFWDVAGVVTSFTVAHSLTLSLSILHIVTLPSRLVESLIAVSVAMAALNNLVPFALKRRWAVAFLFGLLHGFGFAGALADLGLVEGAKALALGGFNLGVEAGQLAVVTLFLPVAYGLRHFRLYQRVVMAAGSGAIVVVALCWLVERTFDCQVLNF
jgi:hypothetical protein